MDPASVGLTFSLFAVVAGLVLLVVWVMLPFAMFGIKPLLRRLIAEQEQTRRAIEALRQPPEK